MANICYVGLPAHGHTNPTLPVMKELVARGHRVLYYNAASFRAKIEPTGVEFRPFPEPLPTEREFAEALHEFVNASLIISKMSRHLTRFLIDEFAKEQPDVVIYDSVAMWGYIAARTYQIPNICFITTFVLDGSQKEIGFGTLARFLWASLPHISGLLKWRREMAREFGKENAGGITEYAPLNIIFTSKLFHPDNSFIDGRFHFVGPALDHTVRDGTFPFEQLQDGTKVYISLGTINHLDLPFYRAVFDAFADYPAQFILSAGKQTDIALLGKIPPNFIVQNYVPQLEILQRVDLFITHGGMNSVHEGLYYGVPQIIVPHHFEQLLNGKQVVKHRAGLMLGEKRPFGRVAPSQLRQALEEILTNRSYQENAQTIGRTLKDAGGFLSAADEIETFVSVG